MGIEKQDDPTIFGPAMWKLLHNISFNKLYNEDTKMILIYEIIDNFPCITCKKHAKEYMDKNDSYNDVSVWLWEFHNFVNKKLNKDIFSWEECIKKYNNESCSEVCSLAF
jgi:hypothetical protein